MNNRYLFTFILLGIAMNQLNAQTYFLQGDAQFIGEDCYRLTTTATAQNGAVWYADQIDLNEGFDLEFTMNFGDIDANGADGICFVLQTVGNNALGQSGGGLGFLGFAPAFAVEFDTWQNGEFGDPFYDHIGMISNGDVSHISANAIAGPVQASEGSLNIEDGQDHIVRIVWEPESFSVEVYFDCVFRLSAEVDMINSIFDGQSLVTWGFTAGTGGSFNNQTVCLQENILSTGPDAFVCNGGSIQLSAGGNPDDTFLWEPSTYLDDPQSQTPTCTPEESITYTVTSFSLCGNEQTATVNVTVEDLQANVSGNQTITCNSPSITLTGSSNFGSAADYNWSSDDGSFITGTGAPSVVVNAAGTYTLTVNVDGDCATEVNYSISENTQAPAISLTPIEDINCNNPTIELTATSDVNLSSINWTSGNGSFVGPQNEANVTLSSGGTYNLTVVNQSNGCANDTSFTVNDDFQVPFINPGSADSLSCLQPAVTIDGASVEPSNATLLWEAAQGNAISGVQSLTPTISEAGWYFLTATDPSNGCSAIDSLQVFSAEDLSVDLSSLVFPNIFTPNNDGRNDRFEPLLLSEPTFRVLSILDVYNLSVYNRWGTLVFSTEGNALPFNGNDLEEGTYFYIVSYESLCGGNSDKEITGSVKITR